MFTDSTNTFEKLLNASQAADLLGIHPVTLLAWARSGRVPSLRLGRKVSFRASLLNEWLTQQGTIQPANRAA
jgi:excisionase family DNA binding protein